MGLSTSEEHGSSKNYLNILGGKITQKVKEGTPGAISRINKQKQRGVGTTFRYIKWSNC